MTERTDRELPGGALKIVALVKMNAGLAYVFNRPIALRYREESIDGERYLIGRDGPIVNCLGCAPATGRMRAFAGRELILTMEDGTVRSVKDNWWSCLTPYPGFASIGYSCVEELARCYVFTSGQCRRDALDELREEYEQGESGGCVYPYWGYEKALRFDSLRKRVFKLEGDKKSLIAEARRQSRRAGAAAAMAEGGDE